MFDLHTNKVVVTTDETGKVHKWGIGNLFSDMKPRKKILFQDKKRNKKTATTV